MHGKKNKDKEEDNKLMELKLEVEDRKAQKIKESDMYTKKKLKNLRINLPVIIYYNK